MARMVSDHKKDGDIRLPYVMAAYRATIHQTTNYISNYVMLARGQSTCRFGVLTLLEQPSAFYDEYTMTIEDRLKQAFSLVREYL